ncbi:glycosyltransferase family 2 protein [Marivirga arenosa]|uniref:Glycosyltransferase family 2 protein n=1 Tax=Marivirga arenosa TaxID=3059076 RepID=A0AA51RDC6_9BACT|nr:glycosyltransferase family 2 protein [Marivirga sp. ABR2-2]WMN07699.1 glycosyltransferase family 2 protein [Marivirga sp. ABR2-2]
MLINILIPTYNREPDLTANLLYLISEIERYTLQSKVSIIVSDNCSQDQTQDSVQKIIANHSQIKIDYFRQSENIGLEKNAVFVFQKAFASHVMFIGDDDLIDKGYLEFSCNKIEENSELGCIIPGVKWKGFKGYKLGRIEEYDYKHLSNVFDSLFEVSHYSSQMSGLLINAKGTLEHYLKNSELRNIYLFISFTSFNLIKRESIFAPKYKTLIEQDNSKDWSYNEIGLLDEVFKAYFSIEEFIPSKQLEQLLLQFIRMQSFRLSIKKGRPITLIRQYFKIIKLFNFSLSFKIGLNKLLIKEYILKTL